jgi:ribosome-associated protein
MVMVKQMDYRKLAKAAAVAADDKKGEDILVLDIRKESDITDYVMIVGASSSAQMGALEKSIEESLLDQGCRVLHREGRPRGRRWIALDFGGLVAHILLSDARDFYRLESLWEKAKPVKWETK